jgi:sugar fermentation stimulation protein A
MRFSAPLTPAVLVRRYQRFLVDVELSDGRQITAHCPNTGSMRSCSAPGSQICLSQSVNPLRKHPYSLEMVLTYNTWVGVNTSRTNSIVVEAIEQGEVPELYCPDRIRKEVKTSPACRLDLAVYHGAAPTFVEVKSCTWVDDGWAMFPDAVTARGTKHLLELRDLVRRGYKGAVFFLVQRNDATGFRPAEEIDTLYARTLKEAHKDGVAVLVYQAAVNPNEIRITGPLPYSLK